MRPGSVNRSGSGCGRVRFIRSGSGCGRVRLTVRVRGAAVGSARGDGPGFDGGARGARGRCGRTCATSARHVDWMSDACSIRFLTEATEGVGVRFECATRVGPMRTIDRMEVTEWQDGQVMGIRHRGAVSGTGQFRLTRCPGPAGETHTRFEWAETLRFRWWMGGPFARGRGPSGASGCVGSQPPPFRGPVLTADQPAAPSLGGALSRAATKRAGTACGLGFAAAVDSATPHNMILNDHSILHTITVIINSGAAMDDAAIRGAATDIEVIDDVPDNICSESPGATGEVSRSQAATERLLDAAVEVFAERGFEAARVAEIARRAGLHHRSHLRPLARQARPDCRCCPPRRSAVHEPLGGHRRRAGSRDSHLPGHESHGHAERQVSRRDAGGVRQCQAR